VTPECVPAVPARILYPLRVSKAQVQSLGALVLVGTVLMVVLGVVDVDKDDDDVRFAQMYFGYSTVTLTVL
jgi:hypothetical protein